MDVWGVASGYQAGTFYSKHRLVRRNNIHFSREGMPVNYKETVRVQARGAATAFHW